MPDWFWRTKDGGANPALAGLAPPFICCLLEDLRVLAGIFATHKVVPCIDSYITIVVYSFYENNRH